MQSKMETTGPRWRWKYTSIACSAGIGAMIAVLGGIDALIFTAGVGEHSPEVRARTCDNLGYAGLKLDLAKNAQSPADQDISYCRFAGTHSADSCQEDWEIARDCWKLLGRS